MNLEVLLVEREIERNLSLLARGMDERDWELIESIFVEQATGYFGTGYEPTTRSELLTMFKRFLGSCGPTQHLLGNLIVAFDGNMANSRCYIRDIHQGIGAKADLYFSTIGEYRDRWLRTPDGWKITNRHKINFLTQGTLKVFSKEE